MATAVMSMKGESDQMTVPAAVEMIRPPRSSAGANSPRRSGRGAAPGTARAVAAVAFV